VTPEPPDAADFLSSAAFAAGAERAAGLVLTARHAHRRHERAVARAAAALMRAFEARGAALTLRSGRTVAVAAGQDVLRPDIAAGSPGTFEGLLATPQLVCEVMEGGSLDLDLGVKIDGWRAATSVDHALWIDPDRRAALHMRRRGARCAFRFYEDGALELDALGVTLDLAALVGSAEVPAAIGETRAPYTDVPLSGARLPRFADVEDFLAWYDIVPGKQRFELLHGAVRFADMRAPGSLGGRAVPAGASLLRLRQRLQESLQALCGPEHAALSSGLLVAIGADAALCPDVMVAARPGHGDGPFVEPVIVAEILTPASAARDATLKLDAWLGRRGVRWVLLVDPEERALMAYETGVGRAAPRLVTGGALTLPPLRGALDVGALLAAE
jgi:Uma2 family endonuclease